MGRGVLAIQTSFKRVSRFFERTPCGAAPRCCTWTPGAPNVFHFIFLHTRFSGFLEMRYPTRPRPTGPCRPGTHLLRVRLCLAKRSRKMNARCPSVPVGAATPRHAPRAALALRPLPPGRYRAAGSRHGPGTAIPRTRRTGRPNRRTARTARTGHMQMPWRETKAVTVVPQG